MTGVLVDDVFLGEWYSLIRCKYLRMAIVDGDDDEDQTEDGKFKIK